MLVGYLRFKGQFNCSLGEFVAIAKSLAIRRYSVSSSPSAPGADPNVVTITVGQVKFTTGTGRLFCVVNGAVLLLEVEMS